MDIGYDKQAIIEYLQSLEDDDKFIMAKLDYVLGIYEECEKKYNRLYCELQADVTNSQNRLYAAQEEKYQAESELYDAQNLLNSSNDSGINSDANYQIQSARQRLAEANQEIEFYSQEYDKADKNFNNLNEVWNHYSPFAVQSKAALEDNYLDISKVFSNASEGLYNYMRTMEMVIAKLRESEINGADVSSVTPPNGASIFNKTDEHAFLSSREDVPLKPAWSATENGDIVFDSPEETGNRLISSQGGVEDFKGTCGLCSVANVIIMSGNPSSERNMVDVASVNDLCTHGSWAKSSNGSTTGENRKALLEKFGINSMLIPQCKRNGLKMEYQTDLIADYVSKGHGVILSVHASKLYNGWTLGGDYHAVTVTSVKKDSQGNVLGFYICDSNNRPSTYYTTTQMQNALTKHCMNVTTNPIRTEYDYS